METLALASAQIHCQCTTNTKMIQTNHSTETDAPATNTSMLHFLFIAIY